MNSVFKAAWYRPDQDWALAIVRHITTGEFYYHLVKKNMTVTAKLVYVLFLYRMNENKLPSNQVASGLEKLVKRLLKTIFI